MTTMTTTTTTTTTMANRPDESKIVDSRFCCNICLDPVVEPVATLCGHLYCWPCLYRWLEPGMYPGERASLGLLQRPFASDSNRRVCPVCKAPCSVPTLVPIYVRESDIPDPVLGSTKQEEGEEGGNLTNRDRIPTDGTGDSSEDGGSGDTITGLRQRIRFRSRDGETLVESSSVPSRPPAQSPRELSPTSVSSTPVTPQRYGTNGWATPLTPNSHHRAGGSLTHGLLLSIQQATTGHSGIPPLHRRDGTHPGDLEAHSGATEYLSRLLLMFASFVILCLLVM
jgi:E3 ubiquitin-protein ligase RNF5